MFELLDKIPYRVDVSLNIAKINQNLPIWNMDVILINSII